MIISPYRFFFHPLSPEHNSSTKILSVITVVALTILTFPVFAIIFVGVNLIDRVQVTPPHRYRLASCSVLKDQFPLKPVIHLQSSALSVPENVDLVSQLPTSLKGKKTEEIKQLQTWQLQRFNKWAKEGDWKSIHDAHFDWWMFPLDRSSQGYGDRFKLESHDIEVLKKDPVFIHNLREGSIRVLEAWGWDLQKGSDIDSRKISEGQSWSHWPVRLAKIADSLKLFEQHDLFNNSVPFYEKVAPTFMDSDQWIHNVFGK